MNVEEKVLSVAFSDCTPKFSIAMFPLDVVLIAFHIGVTYESLQGGPLWRRGRLEASQHHKQRGLQLSGFCWVQVWNWILETWKRDHSPGVFAKHLFL